MLELFNPEIDLALKNWLQPQTWDAVHFSDEGRFYRFVEALVKSGRYWEVTSFDLMAGVAYYHPDIDPSSVQERVSELAAEAMVVQNYFKSLRSM